MPARLRQKLFGPSVQPNRVVKLVESMFRLQPYADEGHIHNCGGAGANGGHSQEGSCPGVSGQ